MIFKVFYGFKIWLTKILKKICKFKKELDLSKKNVAPQIRINLVYI